MSDPGGGERRPKCDPRLVTADIPSLLSARWDNPRWLFSAPPPTSLDFISPSWRGPVYGWIEDANEDAFREIVIARMRAGEQWSSSAEELSREITIHRVDPRYPMYLRAIDQLPEKARAYLISTGQAWRGDRLDILDRLRDKAGRFPSPDDIAKHFSQPQ
jgi:hypothetical protein